MCEKKRMVVALGGNALGYTPKEQICLVKKTASVIADLAQSGYEVVVGHGNGPQVGMINLAMEVSASSEVKTPSMPFPECGAMSQGYIGYHLQQSIRNQLAARKINKNVVSIITQVVVDKNDPAFKNPTKPVGLFYNRQESEKISKENGYEFVEDSGRGYRRVVPSPLPQKIIEIDVIRELVELGNIVITVGGGGIPVKEVGGELFGVSAVIDKDKSCARLASDIGADVFLVLTAVDYVYLNFNKENQQKLERVSNREMTAYCKQGHFAKGSMLPKIEACLEFLDKNPKGVAMVTSLEKANQSLKKRDCTVIYNEEVKNKC